MEEFLQALRGLMAMSVNFYEIRRGGNLKTFLDDAGGCGAPSRCSRPNRRPCPLGGERCPLAAEPLEDDNPLALAEAPDR